MASLLQQAFGAFVGMNSTATASGTAGTPPMAMPTDLSSLIAFLFSFSALRDWLKLIVIGSIFETIRRLAFSTFHHVVGTFWITAYFEEDDSSYDWMMVWLSKQPSWSRAREVQVSTRNWGQVPDASVLVPGEEDDVGSMLSGSRKLAYLPSISATYSLWYKRRLMTVSRVQAQTGYYGRREETLHISILSRNHQLLNDLLLEAKKQYIAGQANSISIYISDTSGNWRHVASRPKRPLRSIILDPGIKDLLVDDARDFLESKSWYTERGIPFRRGYLLYGAPGSGKTSIIHSMAGELGLDVYVVSLSRVGMDDSSLNGLISELPEKCIALMEDIDAAFSGTVNRDAASAQAPKSGDPDKPPSPSDQAGQTTASTRVSLSGLLNALDGVGAQEGRILFATTNKYHALDPALCRPGRMDVHVEFKLASRYQAQEMFRSFYLPHEDAAEDASESGNLDSGYSSTTTCERDLIDLEELDQKLEAPELSAVEPATPVTSVAKQGSGFRHPRVPVLTSGQVLRLARRFSRQLPEREFSMASLQGYLMSYKTRPFDAAKNFQEWIDKDLAERAAKQQAAASVGGAVSGTTTSQAPAG